MDNVVGKPHQVLLLPLVSNVLVSAAVVVVVLVSLLLLLLILM